MWSEIDAGTEVELRIPARIVYATAQRRSWLSRLLASKTPAHARRTSVMSGDTSPIRILAVDDHRLVRQGIAGLVDVQPDMTMVAEAANGRDAISQFRAHRPDVTLMDIQMPEMNGLDALITIRTEFPDAKVIVLTTYEGDVHILRALKAGAQGYLLKNTLHSELLQTIRAVHCGQKEPVARGLVPGRRACERSGADAGRSRRVAPDRGRQREQADRGPARASPRTPSRAG